MKGEAPKFRDRLSREGLFREDVKEDLKVQTQVSLSQRVKPGNEGQPRRREPVPAGGTGTQEGGHGGHQGCKAGSVHTLGSQVPQGCHAEALVGCCEGLGGKWFKQEGRLLPAGTASGAAGGGRGISGWFSVNWLPY